ncbi:P2Y purinoceptor 14 [Aplochiton taeniatus]
MRVYFCLSQHRQSSVTVFLQNLAAADFLLSLCLPLRIANYASDSCHVQWVYCNFGASAFYLNMYASILFMEFIAANRYLKITCPLRRHALQKVRTARILSAVTWGFLLVVSGTYITLSLVTSPSEKNTTRAMGCNNLHSEQLRLFYKIIHFCLGAIFFFVLVSLAFFYYSTTQRLKEVQQNNRRTSLGYRKLSRSKRNMLVLVVVFCVCFVPYHLVRLPFAFLDTPGEVFYYLKEVAVVLSVLNACLDPFIYVIFCQAFRSQLGMKAGLYTTAGLTDTNNGLSGDRKLSEGNSTLKRTSESTLRKTSVF